MSGEMAQQFRAFTALPRYLGSISKATWQKRTIFYVVKYILIEKGCVTFVCVE